MDNSTKLIGQGNFGKVYLSYNIHNKDQKVAIKVLDKSKLEEDKISRVKEEVESLKKLDHPGIMKYYETFED